MPARLRPTAATAPDAILVGDPGRALLLAQEVLTQPKMSNHARGLWGYTGVTATGRPLSVQATGMGAPSAIAVLDDLAALGVRRAVRVGSCAGLGVSASAGALLLVEEAVALGGSATAIGIGTGDSVLPNRELSERLAAALGDDAVPCRVGSFDLLAVDPVEGVAIDAADMQTAALLARAAERGIDAAAVLIVTELGPEGDGLADDLVEARSRRAGTAAAEAMSHPLVEG